MKNLFLISLFILGLMSSTKAQAAVENIGQMISEARVSQYKTHKEILKQLDSSTAATDFETKWRKVDSIESDGLVDAEFGIVLVADSGPALTK